MMQHLRHELYIFDMGNVVLDHVDVLPAVSDELGTSVHEFSAFYAKYVDGLMVGNISPERFWQDYGLYSGRKIENDYLETCFSPVENREMIELLTALRKAGHRVVCGTNTYASHYRYMMSHGMFDHFDAVYASHIIGIAKPDVEFYRHILRQERAQAEKTFFTDDLAENVHAASSIGLHASLFTGKDSIISSL
jgi:putative hydrolase of the HAD superfamily